MHVFFLCPFATEVQRLAPLHQSIHIADAVDFKTALVIFRKTFCLPPTGFRAPILPWLCWFLWTSKNKLIFEDRTISSAEVATRALAAALEWDQAQEIEKSTRSTGLQFRKDHRRDLRRSSTPTCFIDAAWDASTYLAGIAWNLSWAVSDHPLTGTQVIEKVGSPLMGEALALLMGIHKAMDLGISSIIFYSDCATLIRVIVNKSQIKEIYGVLQYIIKLSSHFASIVFQFIPRSQNRDVDLLAKQALQAHLPFPFPFVFVGQPLWI